MSFAISSYFVSSISLSNAWNRFAISADIGALASGIFFSLKGNSSYGGLITMVTICVADIVSLVAKACDSADIEEPYEETLFPKTAGGNAFGQFSLHCAFLKKTLFEGLGKNEAFEGDLIFVTANRGKKKDIPYFNHPLSAPEFTKYAVERGANTEQLICLQPFSNGVCHGASVSFCKDWLMFRNMEYLANKYKNGMPYEAVAFQACYKSLDCKLSREMMQQCQYKFLQKKLKEASNDESSALLTRSLTNADVLPQELRSMCFQTAICLEKGQDFNEYISRIKNYPQKEDDEGRSSLQYFQAALAEMCKIYNNDQAFLQDVANCKTAYLEKTFCNFIGTNVEEKFIADSPSFILESDPSIWNEGTYFLSTPGFSNGYYVGSHSFAFIKESYSSFYLFDSNFGCKQIGNPKESLAKLYKHYCGKALSDKMIFDISSYQSGSKIKPSPFSVHQLFLL